MADQFNVTKKEALVVTAKILEYLEKQWLNHNSDYDAIREDLNISQSEDWYGWDSEPRPDGRGYFNDVRLQIENLLETEYVYEYQPFEWCEWCEEGTGSLPVRKATTHTSCYGWSGYELCQPCADHLDSEPCPIDSFDRETKRCDYHEKGEQE